MPPSNSIEVSSPLPAGHPTKGAHARSIDPCPPPPGARRRATRRAHLGRQSCGLADGHLQVRRRLRPCSLVSDSQHRSGGRGQLSSGGIDPAGHPIPSSHPPTRGAEIDLLVPARTHVLFDRPNSGRIGCKCSIRSGDRTSQSSRACRH